MQSKISKEKTDKPLETGLSVREKDIIQQTEHWVKTVVVGLNFCPFAKREIDNHRVRYVVCDSDKQQEALQFLLDECLYLDQHEDTETTLLIFEKNYQDFSAYLQFVDLAEQLLAMEDYQGIYQVASFHPHYCFEGEDYDDPANYTNRSPLPMVHIIREESLAKAIAAHPNAEGIPQRNVDLAREKGLLAMQKLCNIYSSR